MANNLKLTITAIDKATATVNKVNDSMNRLVSPVRDLKKFGTAIARNPAIDGLKRMGTAARGVADVVGRITGPLAGLTGLGVVAGMAELTGQWMRLGQAIGNTTTSLGASAKGLTTMRGAAQMAGLAAESMDGGLESVRQTLQDARWGRNPPLIALMGRLGLAFRYTKSGSIDAVESMKDIADAMAAQKDVGAKHTIAQQFGVDALFPLLIKGRQAIEDYQKQIEKLGGTPNDDQIARAERYAAAVERLKTAAGGIGRGVADKMQSATLPLINGAADKLAGHQSTGSTVGYELLTRPAMLVALQHLLLGKWLYPTAPRNFASGRITPRREPAAGAGAPLGIRSNNPLNLMPGGREAVFGSLEDGLRAAMRNLLGATYFGGGNDTAAGIISRWSPANASGNSPAKTANYISAVESAVGPGHLNPNDPTVMAKLLSAMARQENGAGAYDQAKMDEAVKHIVIEFKNAPAGTTAVAKTASGSHMPVRIVTAMPAMGSP